MGEGGHMGIYVRKSVKAGPFRFTASRAGVNVSAGIPGFRAGSGPRGNYVSVNAAGLSYRATGAFPARGAGRPVAAPYQPSAVLMEDVTGADALELAPTDGDDLVQQLNEAAGRQRWAWLVVVVCVVAGAVALPYGAVVWGLAVPLCWWLFARDAARRTVAVIYDVDDDAAAWFEALVSAWTPSGPAERIWRTTTSGKVRTTHQHKINAGAGEIVRRMTARTDAAGTKHLATNVAVPSVTVGDSALHFLPDRILIRDGKHFATVTYGELVVTAVPERFIEDPGPLASDAQKVGETWRYVNVKGGPDRRFKNNTVLPIMRYACLHLTSPRGLSWILQMSRFEAAPQLSRVLASCPLARGEGPR
ncbi:DUF4236 domain-containing protein [Clavibacter sp. VKM Ac-2872]|uniref:DUF4236 domain-containing protein n=1 Tax=Clavibacter sp. VKM Ac-2872 TaxID=2783812 RepID=UPI00188DADDB|nr:DUF4236 domain-containing protein [Clavibacter sp. VKM Ac-2872]